MLVAPGAQPIESFVFRNSWLHHSRDITMDSSHYDSVALQWDSTPDTLSSENSVQEYDVAIIVVDLVQVPLVCKTKII